MEIRQTIHSKTTSLKQVNMFFITKRLTDVMISFAYLLVLSPLILLTSYLIIKKDGKPVFFRQVRVGRDHRLFKIWKFRTLTNPSRVIRALPPHPFPRSWKYGVPDKFYFNRDPYQTFTRTGKGIKKFHLDRLPLLFNVLKGDMSLVGPSPEILEIAEYYNFFQEKRLKVKPGIISFAQLNGNTNRKHSQKIKDDIFYIENCSLKFDMIIIYRWFKRIFQNSNL